MRQLSVSLLGSLAIAAIASYSSSAQTQTPWPSWQALAKPAESTSPSKAELPANVNVKSPGADVPKDLAKLSGIWVGWLGTSPGDHGGSTMLAVEELTPTGAKAAYSWATGGRNPYRTRFTMKWENGELWGNLGSGGAWVSYRLREDGNLDGLWNYGKTVYSGVLTRKQ